MTIGYVIYDIYKSNVGKVIIVGGIFIITIGSGCLIRLCL